MRRMLCSKKTVIMVLAAMLTVGTLAGCSNKSNTVSSEKNTKEENRKNADSNVGQRQNAGDVSILETTPGKMRDITSQELVREIKIGWNLGNSLDVCAADTDGDGEINETPEEGKEVDETLWGNVETTEKLFDALKAEGINGVRIPVTWRDHIVDDSTYEINADWMNRVEEVVRYAYTKGMYVIINVHHDGGGDPDFGAWIRSASQGEKEKQKVMKKYQAIWKQIANRFQNYSDFLIFESMNEVGFDDMEREEAFLLLNEFNQSFVDLVRESGGNNSKRHLLIAGYWTDITQTCTAKEEGIFQMPKDSVENREILSVHYYTPWQFCTTNQQNTWGTEADVEQMYELIDTLEKVFVKQGIPVIVGEYGFGQNEQASCRFFTENFVKYTYDKGIASFLWDNGEQFDRTSMKWKLSGLNDVLKRATSGKNYEIKKR